jgi:uncharacterized lipoprotein YmbA
MQAARGAHALLLALVLGGCATPLTERFYTLNASAPPQPVAHPARYRIAVGPVTVPALVDRPQIVLRAGANRVTIAEQSRWAEPLKDSIERVVAGNLALLLDDAQVAAASQGAAAAADYRVLLDVQRFDSSLGDAATLEVLWTVRVADDSVAAVGRSVIREPAGGPGYDALVAAHDRVLAALSRAVAAAIRSQVSRSYPPAPARPVQSGS